MWLQQWAVLLQSYDNDLIIILLQRHSTDLACYTHISVLKYYKSWSDFIVKKNHQPLSLEFDLTTIYRDR